MLAELGAETVVIGDKPDGFNINRDCGSTHLGALKRVVVERQAHLGIALDGDADRCLMVSADGTEIDGDEILYIVARSRLAAKSLRGPVVGTLMSNLGLERAFDALGIGFHRAKVGDRYVMEKLKEHGGMLGGETSGHTLCLDRTTTGDGTVTALQVLAAMIESGRGLAELAGGMSKFPQVLINVKLSGPADAIMAAASVQAAVARAEATLGARGRVLLRPSGTEPLIRVMVEAQEAGETRAAAESIADSVRAAVA